MSEVVYIDKNVQLMEKSNNSERVKLGAELDKDGYCGCPKCGSRNIIHDGLSLDDGYTRCIECYFEVTGNDYYEMINRWNTYDRSNSDSENPK